MALLSRFSRYRTSVLIFLSVVGPGLITANVDNDAGGIYTYSIAGARFGYSLLWTLVPITVALVVIQEMVARMGAVTGKGLADLIREEYGFRATFILMGVLLVANLGNTVAEFAGLAQGAAVLHLHRSVVVPLGAAFVWILVMRGSAKIVERVFLAACFFYVAYLASGFLAHPDWQAAAKGTFVPTARLDRSSVYMIIALVGTTIAPWMQFYLQSAVVEKGVQPKDYAYSRWDVIVGCIITDVVAFFIIVACAATLHAGGPREIRSAADAAEALGPLAGEAAALLFAFGLCNASLFSASILPLATAYSVCEGLGLESGIDRRMYEAPTFYTLYTGLIVVGALTVLLLPETRQISLIVLSQAANGVILPFVLVYMLRLSNREDLMGEYRNSRAFNVIAWTTCVVMIALTLLLVVTMAAPGLSRQGRDAGLKPGITYLQAGMTGASGSRA